MRVYVYTHSRPLGFPGCAVMLVLAHLQLRFGIIDNHNTIRYRAAVGKGESEEGGREEV